MLTAESRQWVDETVATWEKEDGPLSRRPYPSGRVTRTITINVDLGPHLKGAR